LIFGCSNDYNEKEYTRVKPKIISLFSGAGGMDIGFEMAGFETAIALEYDSSCCDTLRANRPNLKIIEGDISSITTGQILQAAELKPLETALVVGGPPCQSFSLAGKRLGMGEARGRLVLDFIRVVREALPIGFVMENVKGMANWEQGAALKAIEDELSDCVVYEGKSYQYVVQHKVLNAADFGVPQFRERIFLVGNRINKVFNFPSPTHYAAKHNPSLFENPNEKQYVSAWDTIGTLPPADEPSDVAMRVSQSIKGRIEKHGY
jgi:DNA (cytosine-5)-methyltransferase 1